jgi:hypothetical protein
MTESERQRAHGEWLAWFKKSLDERKQEPMPAPGYKDCRNCALREDYETNEEKEQFCDTDCPYTDEPEGPSVGFLRALLWSRLPDVFLLEHAGELGVRFCMRVQEIKEQRMNPFG